MKPITGFSFKTKYLERKETALTKDKKWNSGSVSKGTIFIKEDKFFSAFHWHVLYYQEVLQKQER